MKPEVGLDHVVESLSVLFQASTFSNKKWGYSKGLQGASYVIRVLFWRNHSDSRIVLGGTMTCSIEAVAIVQLRETVSE